MNLGKLLIQHLPGAKWLLMRVEAISGLTTHGSESTFIKNVYRDDLQLSTRAKGFFGLGKSETQLMLSDAEAIAKNACEGNKGYFLNAVKYARQIAEAPTGDAVIAIVKSAHPNFLETRMADTALARLRELPYADPAKRARDLWVVTDLIKQQDSRHFYRTLAMSLDAKPRLASL